MVISGSERKIDFSAVHCQKHKRFGINCYKFCDGSVYMYDTVVYVQTQCVNPASDLTPPHQ
jgi:hypothetical protein